MISGKTSGTMMAPMIGALNGNRNRVEARAAQMPSSTDSVAVIVAMKTELNSAPCSASIPASWTNHSVVKPLSGNAMTVPSLKANIGNRITGRYRNTK